MPETFIFQTTVQREISPRLPIRLIGLGMAGLLLTSCTAAQTPSGGAASSTVTETTPLPSPVESSTSQRTPNQTSCTPTSTLNPALSETCQLDTGSIYSGGKFNQGNSDDITNQLSALAVAKNNNPISFADTRHAASLLANATIDDKYAAGLTIANQAPVGAVPSVGELLVAVAALPPDAAQRSWCTVPNDHRWLRPANRQSVQGTGIRNVSTYPKRIPRIQKSSPRYVGS